MNFKFFTLKSLIHFFVLNTLIFVCPKNCVTTVGKNTARIKEYIANQLKEDQLGEQIKMDFSDDPFKVEK